MPIKYSRIALLLFLALALTLLLSLPAAAAATAFVTRDHAGSYYEYSYQDLLDSFALKLLGRPNGLYEDFTARKPYAILDSVNGYICYEDILDHYARALVLGQSFDLNSYLESSAAGKAIMPGAINLVKLESGRLVQRAKTVGSANPGPGSTVQSPAARTAIVGPAQVSLQQAQQWARSRQAHQRLIDIAPLYWQYGKLSGMRPEVLYAQAAVETDFGRYSGTLPPEYNNWAGIKLASAGGDSLADHENFADPETGVRAHYNHMAAYVGLNPIGEPHGRFHVVAAQNWNGTVRYLEEVCGRWTTTPGYASYIVTLVNQMKVTADPNSSNAVPPDNPRSGPSPEPAGGGSEVVVDVAVLRLRSGPGTDYEILDRLTRGTVLTVTGNQKEWLAVNTPGGKSGWVHGDYVRAINTGGNSLKGKKIVVDPGHGGSDPGAVGISGLREKEVTLAVALHLSTLLREAGAEVIMTRSGDQSVSNQQRVDLANQAAADLFISVHANAFPNPESNGTETHYCPVQKSSAAGRDLAHHLQRELVLTLGLRDRGVKTSSFFVLTNTKMPAALVELGFLTNPSEEALLRKPETHVAAAEAIFRAIRAYLGSPG